MTALLQQWLAEQPATSTDSGHATPPGATAVPARRSDLLLGPWIQAGALRQIDGLDILVIGSDIANMRVSQRHDLPGI